MRASKVRTSSSRVGQRRPVEGSPAEARTRRSEGERATSEDAKQKGHTLMHAEHAFSLPPDRPTVRMDLRCCCAHGLLYMPTPYESAALLPRATHRDAHCRCAG